MSAVKDISDTVATAVADLQDVVDDYDMPEAMAVEIQRIEKALWALVEGV